MACRNDLMLSTRIELGDYRHVLKDVCSNLIVTSPPYNIGSKRPRADGRRRLGLYDPKSFGAIRDYDDHLLEPIYQDQQAAFMIWAADHLDRDGVLVYNHKLRKRDKRLIDPAEWYLRPEVKERLHLVEDITWDRGSTHNHDMTQLWAQTERLYVFRRTDGVWKFRNQNVSDAQFRTDVWRIPLTNNGNGHNCPWPMRLARGMIEVWSEPGDLVCDPYCGHGTVGVAAVSMGRNFVGAEQLERYWEQATQEVEKALENACQWSEGSAA